MKRKILGIAVIICIIIISIISILLYFYSKDNNILFKYSYENYAWGARSYGYFIYSNGDIKEYDDYDNDSKLKSAKISKKELAQLIELSNMVEDKYENDTKWQMIDAGITIKQIYNSKLSKWVILSKSGDSNGRNSSETSQKILELTNQLYNKYLSKN